MDRNSIIGFILLIALGAGLIFYNNYEQNQYRQQVVADSIARAETFPAENIITDVQEAQDEKLLEIDTSLPSAYYGRKELIVVSNADVHLKFSTKGGYPEEAKFLKHNNYYGGEAVYFGGESNKLSFNIPVEGQLKATSELFYSPELIKLSDGSQQLKLTADLGNGKVVVMDYIVPKEGYMMKANMRLVGLQQDLAITPNLQMQWDTEVLRTEKNIKNERMYMQLYFRYADTEVDYFTVSRKPQKNLEKPVQWFGVRSHFFNSTIIADKEFKSGAYNAAEPNDTAIVATNSTFMEVPVLASNDFNFGFQWFIGPNDYKLLKSYNIDMEEMIQLGFGIFFFVKYISKWMIIPLFDFFSGFTTNMGVIIILITLVIRLLLSFFSYKSFLSSAKMRVLKPELDKLRAKLGDNQQQMGMEQMKLYRTAGVNPLGGCLPLLLQMPFLLSMYYFFPTAIQLRQAEFLWAEDLSTYDSILDLPFNIPMYGDHVSLFTLLMTVTSLFLALYNRNMTAGAAAGGNDMNMKMLKWMPYIMPIMFLGWFNSMAAGLTFYYAFSNILSIIQQFVIQKFFIDEKKILQKIEENRKRPANAGTSKWQQRLEEMQKVQAERMKQKNR